jgi:hypothetical protein
MGLPGAAATDDLLFTARAGNSWFERMRLTNAGHLLLGEPVAPNNLVLARLQVGSSGPAVIGRSAQSHGLYGVSDDLSGFGVVGLNNANNGVAVSGEANVGGAAIGVRGKSSGGVGVTGESSSGVGLIGRSSFATGIVGLSGAQAFALTNSSNDRVGVFGKSVLQLGVGVVGEGDGTGVRGHSSSGNGVRGVSDASNDAPSSVNSNPIFRAGVYGEGAAESGVGVYGEGGGHGVRGLSSNGYGVYGKGRIAGVYGYAQDHASVINPIGVYGEHSGADGFGVYGHSSGGYGVRGHSQSGVGVHARSEQWDGLVAISQSGFSDRAAVRAIANGNSLAGKFEGDVDVTGNLSKGGGSFKIDHPLDPANKYLYHSFVESPEMMNIYNGVVALDAKGEAVVTMPDYFEALNRDFRYQLTCIGGFAPVYVGAEIAGNQFKIAGGAAGLKVSWQVTGVRQDAFANKHRIPVEEEKSAALRGHYLHPSAFNQPEEKSIEWARHPEMMKRIKAERDQARREQNKQP